MNQPPLPFWGISAHEILQQLHTGTDGLTADEAKQRLTRYGSNLLKPPKRSDLFALLLAQFKSPITLILLCATGLSFGLRDPVDAFIILTIVVVSGVLGFWQERSATNAVEKLLAIVQVKAAVLRDGSPKEIPADEIVPGDVVILSAGGIIPGDCLVQESKDLFVDEATLTGETYPVEKSVGVLAAATPLGQRTNALAAARKPSWYTPVSKPSLGRCPSGSSSGRRKRNSNTASGSSATSSLHPTRAALWIWPDSDFVPANPGDHHRALPHCSGDHEDGVLPDGESLKERPSIS